VAHAGQRIENPVTGEQIMFARTAADTGGELLELEDRWTRRGRRTVEHVHPEMEERFEIVSGTARFLIGGKEFTAGAGDEVTVAPGTPHVAWNPADEPVQLILRFRPALRWEDFVERLFALAADGATDENGIPEPAVMRALLAEFSREIAPAPRTR
jgi:mannose-6-phosphate isomerase-like protein (cupin superfamily)